MRSSWLPIVLILSAVLLPQAAMAQPSWDLYLKGGWSSAGFMGGARDLTGQDGRNGFAGGIAAEFRSNENLGFEFGVWYAQKGSSGRISNELATTPGNPPRPPADVVEGDFDVDYLSFSILFALHEQIGDQWDIKGYFGPSLGNLLKGEFDGTVNGTPEKIDLEPNLSSIDYAVVLGAGVAYELQRVSLLLDIRGEFGLTNIDDRSADEDIRTRAVIVTAGVAIPLAR